MTSGKGVKGQDNEFGKQWMQNAKKRELTKFYPSKIVCDNPHCHKRKKVRRFGGSEGSHLFGK